MHEKTLRGSVRQNVRVLKKLDKVKKKKHAYTSVIHRNKHTLHLFSAAYREAL